MRIKDAVRTLPDYPRPSVMFCDITTFGAMRAHSELLSINWCSPMAGCGSIKSRASRRAGLILGEAVAHQLSVGFAGARARQTSSADHQRRLHAGVRPYRVGPHSLSS